QGWPRWHAFYRLQQTLQRADANHARQALLKWAGLRWHRRHAHLTTLPCRQDPHLAARLAAGWREVGETEGEEKERN
ncbi:hypothetical protein ACQ4LF_23380, partial [Aeromonas salmonicida]